MSAEKNKTLLLVDGESASAQLSKVVLENNGYRVIHAATGEDAVEIVDISSEIILILMEIDLGCGMDGAECAEEILTNRNIPILFFTSHCAPEVIAKTESVKSYGIVLKNSGESLLLHSIKTALRLFDEHKRKITDIEIIAPKAAENVVGEKNETLTTLNTELDTINRVFRVFNNELKERNAMLKVREEQYRTLFENTGSGIIVVEDDATISLANRCFMDHFNYSIEDIENKRSWTEIVYEDDVPFMMEQHRLRRDEPGKAESDYEFRVVGPDGELKYFMAFVTLIPGTKKSIVSIIDVTESRIARSNLQAAEKKFRDLFMNLQIGISLTDIKTGLVIEANDRLARIFGFKDRDEILSEPFFIKELYYDQADRVKMVKLLIENGVINNYEVQFRRRDGSSIWIRYAARLIVEHGWIEGLHEDITELKTAEFERSIIYNNLLSHEKKYRLIFENSPIGLIHFTKDGVITDCNPAFEKIIGAGWYDLIGLDMLKLSDSGIVSAVYEVLNGRTGNYEGLFHTVNLGGGSLIRAKLESVYDENRNIIGGVGIVEDISDKRSVELGMLDELEQERSRIGRILHDSLGQKLGAVLYLSQALRIKYSKTGELSESDLKQMELLSSSALEETRSLSRGLDISIIDIGSFLDLLDEFTLRIKTIYGIDAILDVQESLMNYGRVKLINLYYIILESVNNAIRHGKASQIILRYFTDGHKGYFEIASEQENFIKIDNDGMGLRIMKYRAKVSGMELSIVSDNKRVIVVVNLGILPVNIMYTGGYMNRDVNE